MRQQRDLFWLANIAAAVIVGWLTWAFFFVLVDHFWRGHYPASLWWYFAPEVGTLIPLAILAGRRFLMWALAIAPFVSVTNAFLFVAFSDGKVDEALPYLSFWFFPMILLKGRIFKNRRSP